MADADFRTRIVVVVVVTVDAKTGEVLSGPEIITRGWIMRPMPSRC